MYTNKTLTGWGFFFFYNLLVFKSFSIKQYVNLCISLIGGESFTTGEGNLRMTKQSLVVQNR